MSIQVLGKKCPALLLSFLISHGIYGANQRSFIELFPITKEPSPSEWKGFFETPEPTRAELWAFHQRKGRELRDWSWQWRIAWVRSCAASQEEYCSLIMTQGLADPAMVVRAEAAARIGDRFQDSEGQFPLAISVLVQAYQHPFNNRHDDPMFVKFRILEALHKIGGPKALEQGNKLAENHPKTKNYWRQLARL